MRSSGAGEKCGQVVRTSEIDVGLRPRLEQEHEVFKIHFHDFRGLPCKKGQFVLSPVFSCFHNEWRVKLYPRGNDGAKPGMTSVFLMLKSDGGTIKVQNSIFVTDAHGKRLADRGFCWDEFSPERPSLGWSNFLPRREIKKSSMLLANNGAFTVELHMISRKACYPPAFFPPNPFNQCIYRLFLDEASADLLIHLTASKYNDDPPLPHSSFYVHKTILHACAPTLADLCQAYDKTHPVPLYGTQPFIFKELLRYLYGGTISNAIMTNHSKDLLEAADKYNVIPLKLEVEARYVHSLTLNQDNIQEEILYAHAKNCALLKEATMEYMEQSKKQQDLLQSQDHSTNKLVDSQQQPPPSTTSCKQYFETTDYTLERFQKMTICQLRNESLQKGLDIDGSREMLLSRLQKEN